MRMTRAGLLLLAIAPAGILSAQGQDWSKVEVGIEPVAGNVRMLTGQGGNIGVLVGEDGIILVDDQYAPLTEKIVTALKGLSPKPVRFVINTHLHGDHTGGNENLGKGGSIIVAHDNVRRRMTEEQFNELLGNRTPPAPTGALPIVTFSADVTLHQNGEEMHVFHVDNAHTDGDSIVHFREANVIHMGDTYFNGMFPFVDTSAGGSIDGVIAAADKVLVMMNDQTLVIPGHGKVSRRAELQRYRDVLATVRSRMLALIESGKTYEEIAAAAPMKDLDAEWGWPFITPERLLKMAYIDLSRKHAKQESEPKK
jgi:glyoxylase-like metal-dependent hydrolase (beta-lactamase superfamily II)